MSLKFWVSNGPTSIESGCKHLSRSTFQAMKRKKRALRQSTNNHVLAEASELYLNSIHY